MNLEKMSHDELMKLRKDVDKALKTVESRRLTEAKKAAEAAAKEYGFSLDDLMGGRKSGGGKTTKGVAKYRNPDDASQTWTGRGRKPNWVVAALKKGKSLDDFQI